MDLNRRLAKLETAGSVRQARMEPTFSPEQLERMQRIMDRLYADPEQHADSIAIYERINAEQATAEGVVQG